MKYFLFDVSVLAILLAGALRLLGYYDAPPPPAPAPPECDPPDGGAPAPECAASDDEGATPERAREQETPPRAKAPPRRPRPTDVFVRGEKVTAYDPAMSTPTFRAQIFKVTVPPRASGEARYDLIAGPGMKRLLHGVDPSQIRSREPYAYNTPAVCNVGMGNENDVFRTSADLAPCYVLAEVDGGEAYKLLGVRDGKLGYYELPWWRVRSIDDGASSPISLEGFDAEMGKHLDDPRDPANDNTSILLEMRGLVELLGDGAFGFPAIITDHHREADGGHVYELVQPVQGAVDRGVDARFVRPYRIYGNGIRTRCKIDPIRDKRLEYELIKCTVLSHSVQDVGFVSYRVSYIGEGKRLVEETLPFTRIFRG